MAKELIETDRQWEAAVRAIVELQERRMGGIGAHPDETIEIFLERYKVAPNWFRQLVHEKTRVLASAAITERRAA
jgi:hypothetical protein